MKWLLFSLYFLSFQHVSAQNLSGKWLGKITQQPGGYSQLYDLELDLNQKKSIYGDSYSYEGDSVRIRIGLYGKIDKDSIRLNESLGWVKENQVPREWVACIKQFALVYRQDNNFEYLEGTWSGYSKENPNDICIPGRVILSRSVSGIEKFLEEHKDSMIQVQPLVLKNTPQLHLDFSSSFLETEPKKITEIVVQNRDLQIQLIDYMRVDNDTVSVFLNRNLLAKDIRISKRPALLNFSLDTRIELHEVLLYAENLGMVPPNTSEMILVDGESRHRVMIASDKQKTAAVYLRYRPKRR